MTEHNNLIILEKLSLDNNCELNILIGSKIKLLNSNIEYIFYGYNHNKTLISCFPASSNNVFDNMIYVSTKQIEKVIL